MKGFSIIICCFNSRLRLEPTLSHLANLYREEILTEIILVDNLSTDGTAQFAQKFWDKLGHPFPMVIVEEPKQGLSFARHTGVHLANFDLVVFCDDDNWLKANYLLEAQSIIANQPNVAALGGFGTAIAEVDLPDWFEVYKGGYAISDESMISGLLPEGSYLTGAGMVLKKALYLRAYENLPSLLTDRAGNQLSSGGDTEICLRFKLMGYGLYFDKRLKFFHFIPKERLTETYRDRLFAGFKIHAPIVEYYEKLIWAQNISLMAKTVKIIIIASKLPFTSLGIIKRWNLERDLLTIFVLTGINFHKLPKNWIHLFGLMKSRIILSSFFVIYFI